MIVASRLMAGHIGQELRDVIRFQVAESTQNGHETHLVDWQGFHDCCEQTDGSHIGQQLRDVIRFQVAKSTQNGHQPECAADKLQLLVFQACQSVSLSKSNKEFCVPKRPLKEVQG